MVSSHGEVGRDDMSRNLGNPDAEKGSAARFFPSISRPALRDQRRGFRLRRMSVRLLKAPISLEEANEFVRLHHRHHKPVVGHKFSIAAVLDGVVVGVVIVGRPVSRHRDDGRTLEVTRMCSNGTRNTCSFLYGAAARAAFALGYVAIGTYIRADEDGRSLAASGWREVGRTKGRSWDCQSRPRLDGTEIIDRTLFELRAA